MKKKTTIINLLLIGIFTLTTTTTLASAADMSKLNALVDKARITVESFTDDPGMQWLREHLKDAKGIIIVPVLLKAAFFFGGGAGDCVLLARNEKTGEWGYPAFYTIGDVSFGLQIGAKTSEVIMVVRTQKGLEELYTSSFNLGADTTIALGPVGAGAKAATAPSLSADYLSFSRSKGIFAGLSLKGAYVRSSADMNSTYYNKSVRPTDILVKHNVRNPKADKLREAVAKIAKK